MQSLARAVPDEDRSLVLSYVESLLAPYDPGLAWHLITSVLGAEGAVQHALGLDVAAHLDLVRASPWRPGVAMPAPLARQLTADRTARSAVAGELGGLGDPRLAGLGSDPDQIAMTPAQARVLAVAGAAADPGRVVDVGTHLLRRFPVHDLDASLRLMSRIAARAGFGHRVAAQARVEGFVTEQSAWVGAAAMAGALPVVAVVDLVRTLGPRIRDELDPGGELAAGLALIEALLYVGAVDEAMTWAVHWRLPVAVLVRRCLFAGLRSAAGRLATDPSLSRLTAAATDPDPDEIPRGLHGADAWWQPAGAEPAERLGALRDILAVVARTPWRVVPGSLADLLGVPADGDADGDADATQR